ncbi:MAG: protoglobin domain-containing protein [Nitrospinota bacterium]|nr:protoglobin domain-containing protein [Nitrospinota bacterium]
MHEMKRLLDQYKVTAQDIENLKSMAPLVAQARDSIADYHYNRLLNNNDTAKFFPDEAVLKRARMAFLQWLDDLFSGQYDVAYYTKLVRVGAAHVRIGLPAYMVNVQMSHIRGYLCDFINTKFKDNPQEAASVSSSLNKMVDLNMDSMTRSYREEELKTHFLTYKLDSVIMSVAKWFVNGFNMVLVVGLVVTGALALVMAVNEALHSASMGLERVVLGLLGTLLILWVVIELLDTQIGHIKGRAFAIKVFVSVALVAELRKILTSSISHASWEEQVALAGSVLILGLIYWLISKTERV